MRHPITRLAFALSFLAVAACGNDDNGPSGPANTTPRNGSMTARIDGAAWSASAAVVGTRSGTILAIAGTDGSNRTIGFALAGATPGTYTVATTAGTNATLTEGSRAWQAVATLGSGSVTLTSISTTRAVGTFTFTLAPNASSGATGTKAITQGAFDVTF